MRTLPVAAGVALLASALATAALPAAPPGDPIPGDAIPDDPRRLDLPELRFEVPVGEEYRHRLPGGAVAYVAADRSLPLFEVAVALRAGADLEPAGQTGLAALTAALLRRGGTVRRTADELDDAFARLACEADASAGERRAGAALSCPSWVLSEALDLFFEMLATPRFDPDRLELARSNLLAGMARRNDDPLAVLDREWSWLLYGRDTAGTRPLTPASLAAIDRASLADFHRRHWRPSELVLAVSGDVDAVAVVAALGARLSTWPPAPSATGDFAPPAPPSVEERPRLGPAFYHFERDLPQAKIVLGHRGPRRDGWDDPEAFALLVMNQLLGAGELVSRLGGRLRSVEGLAYQAGSSLAIGDRRPGELRLLLETDNATAARAVLAALEEVERLRRRRPSEEEVELARRGLTDAVPLSFDTAEEIAGYFAEDELIGRPHAYWRRYRDRIAGVDAEAVRRAAQRHLHPDRMLLLTVGRWSEIAAGPGAAELTARYGAARMLPRRDPLTLEPVPAAASPAAAGDEPGSSFPSEASPPEASPSGRELR